MCLAFVLHNIITCIISLQSFKRHGKQVKAPKEAQYWSDITADMMLDEEKQGDVYIRHPPSYRSST